MGAATKAWPCVQYILPILTGDKSAYNISLVRIGCVLDIELFEIAKLPEVDNILTTYFIENFYYLNFFMITVLPTSYCCSIIKIMIGFVLYKSHDGVQKRF